eukprot:gene1234-1558_t
MEKESVETTTKLKTTTKDYKSFKTLSDFGYFYNDEQKLRSIEHPEKGFQFVDQEHYDLLSDIIVEHIQNTMKKEPYNLDEVLLPLPTTTTTEQQKQCNIFLSKDFYENKEKLMVILCGSGAVKAGVWARSLCINDSLKNGTIFGYLDKARENGFAVIVLNPNFYAFTPFLPEMSDVGGNPLLKKSKKEPPPPTTTPLGHLLQVYDEFITKSPAKDLVIVAHSYGGVITSKLLQEREGDNESSIYDRLKVVALTDSVHTVNLLSGPSKKFVQFFADHEKTRNWVKSDQPGNTDLGHSKIQGCGIASAGHKAHEFTSAYCKDYLFDFVLESLKNQSSKK